MKVTIEVYKWEGKFFPFKIKQRCGECSLSINTIKHVINNINTDEIDIELIEKPWLDNWYKVLHKGAWHAPIVLVNGKLLSQGVVVPKEQLIDRIYSEAYKDYTIPKKGTYIFSQKGCTYCDRAKKLLKKNNIKYTEMDIIESSANMKKLLALVLGKVHPITTPQIFMNGKWIGGYEELEKYLNSLTS